VSSLFEGVATNFPNKVPMTRSILEILTGISSISMIWEYLSAIIMGMYPMKLQERSNNIQKLPCQRMINMMIRRNIDITETTINNTTNPKINIISFFNFL
jgi:hypothetical protein